jgi:hypothetical protein
MCCVSELNRLLSEMKGMVSLNETSRLLVSRKAGEN